MMNGAGKLLIHSRKIVYICSIEGDMFSIRFDVSRLFSQSRIKNTKYKICILASLDVKLTDVTVTNFWKLFRERPREVFGVSDKKLPPGMSENTPWMLHNDWMTSIKYLSHSNSLITTGMDSQLLMLDFEKRQIKWSGNEHANGIYACDYCRCNSYTIIFSLKHRVIIMRMEYTH